MVNLLVMVIETMRLIQRWKGVIEWAIAKLDDSAVGMWQREGLWMDLLVLPARRLSVEHSALGERQQQHARVDAAVG